MIPPLEEPEPVEPQPSELVTDLDASGEDVDQVDTAAGLATESTPQSEAATADETTTSESTDMVSAPDEGDTGFAQNILPDSLSGAKKAAANILRMPYDSIRRRDCESVGSASDDGGEAAAVESTAAAGPGLMSRTLGSISALPSLFVKSTDSAGATPPPSSPRSTPDKPDRDRDRSPGSTRTRTFFFHRLVGRSATNSSETEADTPDASRTADDGKLNVSQWC